MLAQSFKSSAELGITEPQKEALMKTLVLLETGRLVHITGEFSVKTIFSPHYTGHFNMRAWSAESDCGTIRCIGGTAEAVGNVKFDIWSYGSGANESDPRRRLYDLFSPPFSNRKWGEITNEQAATALRSYLTTGDAKWHEAIV